MKKVSKGPEIYLYEVSHPDYPTVIVPSISRESATMEAARRWDVPELWGRIAGYCTVKKGGTARKPRCRRCGNEFGLPGQAEGLCAECRYREDLRRREAVRYRGEDRRAGVRE